MAFESHVEFLKKKHARLDNMLREEQARPAPDVLILHHLKSEKLESERRNRTAPSRSSRRCLRNGRRMGVRPPERPGLPGLFLAISMCKSGGPQPKQRSP